MVTICCTINATQINWSCCRINLLKSSTKSSTFSLQTAWTSFSIIVPPTGTLFQFNYVVPQNVQYLRISQNNTESYYLYIALWHKRKLHLLDIIHLNHRQSELPSVGTSLWPLSGYLCISAGWQRRPASTWIHKVRVCSSESSLLTKWEWSR